MNGYAATAKEGQIFTDQSAANYQAYLRSEVYNEYWKPLEAEHLLQLYPIKQDDWTTVLLFRRSAQRGFYSQQEIQKLEFLAPHLSQSLQISRKFTHKNFVIQAFESTLNTLGTALLLVDKSGRIVLSNTAAENIINQRDGFVYHNRCLGALAPRDNQRVQTLIRRAFDIVAAKGQASLPPVSISRPSGLRPYSLAILPMITGLVPTLPDDPMILLVMSDPEAESPDMKASLMSLFSLTATEADLVSFLCKGHTLAEFAQARQVKVEAPRYHLKNIFQKLNINRQSELIGLVMKVLPAIQK